MSDIIQLKPVSDGVLLLINPEGKLRYLYTPFRVLCMQASFGVPANTWVYVDAVYSHPQYRIGFLIQGNIHPYNQFQIKVNF
ncbi:MAG: hypothetical protein IM581_13105 [Chitinophagaceae bacterium]|nr:hypothetical protein [Chitinophagaceae bacterium]